MLRGLQRFPGSWGAIGVTAACAALFAGGLAADPRVLHTRGLASKKGASDASERPPLLATLVQTHTDERVPLDSAGPSAARFDALLADRVTGSTTPLDPRLLELLRAMAAVYTQDGGGAARIELVSGFRSPKLNEMMRKKGHHVASHSQHSLGHAVDFRVVVTCPAGAGGDSGATGCADAGDSLAIDPRALQLAIRATGWSGGVGVYTSKDDWFVHADVGPRRDWYEGPLRNP